MTISAIVWCPLEPFATGVLAWSRSSANILIASSALPSSVRILLSDNRHSLCLFHTLAYTHVSTLKCAPCKKYLLLAYQLYNHSIAVNVSLRRYTHSFSNEGKQQFQSFGKSLLSGKRSQVCWHIWSLGQITSFSNTKKPYLHLQVAFFHFNK